MTSCKQTDSPPRVYWITGRAEAYLKRPNFSPEAVGLMLAMAGISQVSHVCDAGTGVTHLTLMRARFRQPSYDNAALTASTNAAVRGGD